MTARLPQFKEGDELRLPEAVGVASSVSSSSSSEIVKFTTHTGLRKGLNTGEGGKCNCIEFFLPYLSLEF